MGKYITGILLGLFFINLVVAQQVWPVQVTGAMIPPHSLNLGVYGAERANDLTFNAMLKDPVQASLDVRLSLSIEQNGNVIYQTDPNYVGVPLTLSQFQNILIDGNALRSYLNKEALTGANRTGTGSLEIPEGFNQICLQVYGLERNVPVSNKFCVSGNFRLNQPPQFVKPACGEKIKIMETQNMIFNWSPMHLGSPNSPGAVEYEFELVQLPQGTFNANDAFDSALKVYRSKSLSPSLFYSQAEPKLIPGVVYAWRVKAASVLHPTSKLFQNDGLSQICTFMMYDGEKPTDDINPIDNPAPRGCEVFNTEYSPIDRSETVSQSLIEGDVIKVGYFNMKVQRVTGGPAGYSGEGLVEYPMLRSFIPVTFQGVMVNSERRVFMSDRIEAVVSPSCALSEAQLNKDQIAQHVTSTYFTTQLLPEIQENDKYVRSFDANKLTSNTLPLAIGQRDDMPFVYIVGMLFTPSNAFLHMVSEDSKTGNAIYAATAVQATPYGVKNGAHLVPLSSGGLTTANKVISTIELVASNDGNSRMNCDCSGYKDINIQEVLQISPDIMVRADNGGPVVLDLKDKKSDMATYFGEAGNLPEFELKGSEGYRISSTSAWVDLNPSQKPTSIGIPVDSDLFKASGRGIVLNESSVLLPSNYNIINQEGGLSLNKGIVVVNEEKIESAQFYKHNVLSIEKGKFGPWAYSIDTMKLNLTEKEKTLRFSGSMKTPFFSNNFNYDAELLGLDNSQTRINADITQTTLQMPMWRGQFAVNERSEVVANMYNQDNQYSLAPKCDFNGILGIKMTNDEFTNSIINKNKGATIDELKNALGIDNLSFEMSNLRFENLINDPFKEKSKRNKVGQIDPQNAKFSFGNISNKITDASLIYDDKDNRERLGLKLIIVQNAKKIELTIWSESKDNNFIFEGIEVNKIDLKCNCGITSVSPSKETWDKIIEDFYNEYFGESLADNSRGGIRVSAEHKNFFETQKEAIKLAIKNDAIGWFPSLNNKSSIHIPFLKRDLSIENKGSAYFGKHRNDKPITKNIEWTKEIFNSIQNESTGDLFLPLLITENMWSEFGFHGNYTLPDNFKLFISEFKAPDETINNATLKIALVGLLNVEGKEVFVHFENIEEIKIGPDSLDLKNKLLHLTNDMKLDDRVTFLASPNNEKNSEFGSFVSLDCSEGLHNFNIQGKFTADQKTIIKMEGGNNAQPSQAVFGFTLIENEVSQNDKLLVEFIAPLKKTYKDGNQWKPWTFSTEDGQQILFTSADQIDSYLDYSSEKSVTLASDDVKSLDELKKVRIFSEYFKGIIFNKIECQIPILEAKRSSKESKPETFKDIISIAFYETDTKSFFADYEGVNKITKENNARMGGWSYFLDTLRFKIEFNYLDQDKLYLKGGSRMPIFKEAPTKEKEKWLETYSDAWIPFQLNVEYNLATGYPEISGYVTEIEESLFESKHIEGLGLKLSEESSIEFSYNKVKKQITAKANLNGRSVYHIESLDANIPLLAFQDFKVNYDSTFCNSNGTDGIENLDFGTWGIIEFSELEKTAFSKVAKGVAKSNTGQNNNKKIKENKFVKSLGGKLDGLNKIAGFEINVQQPTFECNGNDWKFYIGLDVSLMRDKDNLTKNQKDSLNAYNPLYSAIEDKKNAEKELQPLAKEYKDAQTNIKSIADERTKLIKRKQLLQTEIKTFKADRSMKINNETKTYNSAANKSEIEKRNNEITSLSKQIEQINTKYKAAIATVKEKYNPYKAQNAKTKEATNKVDGLTKISLKKKEDYKASSMSDRLKSDKRTFKEKWAEAKATKTGAFSASGTIEVTFNNEGFKGVALTCLELGGEFGPVKFVGGINFFKDNGKTSAGNAQTAWGNGFLGMINMKILKYEFSTKFQTGVKSNAVSTNSESSDFRYWFADLSFNGSPGIPLGNTSFSMTGVGGGLYYNMSHVIQDSIKKVTPPAVDNNDNCKSKNLEAGKSLSGMQYKVKEGSLGGYISAEISHPAKISVEGTLSLQFGIRNGQLRFENFGLGLNGFLFYKKYEDRKDDSPGKIRGKIDVNFEENIKVIGRVETQFGLEAGPLTIEAPQNDNWNTILFHFSGDKNYVHAGSWGIPDATGQGPASGLNFLSAGFDADLFGSVEAGLYAQVGNITDGLPPLSYLIPDYKGSINELSSVTNATGGIAANAGFKFKAEMSNSFLCFRYSASALVGANLAIENKGDGLNCNGKTEKVGFSNGYYVSGNAFANLQAKAYIDTYVKEYEILDANLNLELGFGFPNPSYLLGEFQVEYSVLGGLYEGIQNFEIDLGDKPCSEYQTDPLVGIKAHNSFDVTEGDDRAFHRIDRIKVKHNIQIGKTYVISKKDKTTADLVCSLEVNLKEKSTGNVIPVYNDYNVSSKKLYNAYSFITNKIVPNTRYIIEAKYTWTSTKTDANGSKSTSTLKPEIVTKEFITSPNYGIKMHNDLIIDDLYGDSSFRVRKLDSFKIWHRYNITESEIFDPENKEKKYLTCELEATLTDTFGNKITTLTKGSVRDKIEYGYLSNLNTFEANIKINTDLKPNTKYVVKAIYKWKTFNKAADGSHMNVKYFDEDVFTRDFTTSPNYDIKAFNQLTKIPCNGVLKSSISEFDVVSNFNYRKEDLKLSSVEIRDQNYLLLKTSKNAPQPFDSSKSKVSIALNESFVHNHLYTMTGYYTEFLNLTKFIVPDNYFINETFDCPFVTSPFYGYASSPVKEILLPSSENHNRGEFYITKVYKGDDNFDHVVRNLNEIKILHDKNDAFLNQAPFILQNRNVISLYAMFDVSIKDLNSGQIFKLKQGGSEPFQTDKSKSLTTFYIDDNILKSNTAYEINVQLSTEAQIFEGNRNQKDKYETLELFNLTHKFKTDSLYTIKPHKEIIYQESRDNSVSFGSLHFKHNVAVDNPMETAAKMVQKKIRLHVTIKEKGTNREIKVIRTNQTNLYHESFYEFVDLLKPNTTYIVNTVYSTFITGSYASAKDTIISEFTTSKDYGKTFGKTYDNPNVSALHSFKSLEKNISIDYKIDKFEILHNTDIEKEREILDSNGEEKFMRCNLKTELINKTTGISVSLEKTSYNKNIVNVEEYKHRDDMVSESRYKIASELKPYAEYRILATYNWETYTKTPQGEMMNVTLFRVERDTLDFSTVSYPKEGGIFNSFVTPINGERVDKNMEVVKIKNNANLNQAIYNIDLHGFTCTSMVVTLKEVGNRMPAKTLVQKEFSEKDLIYSFQIPDSYLKSNTTYSLKVTYGCTKLSFYGGNFAMEGLLPITKDIIFTTGD